MSSTDTNLFSLARSKLHLSVGGKDNCSLHRWVLLKNSIILSVTPASTAAVTTPQALNTPVSHAPSPLGDAADAFIYPDVEKYSSEHDVPEATSEAQWLDSLLETLGDDDDNDDDDFSPASSIQALPALPDEDDEDALLSPLPSPMSSSDDLTNLSSSSLSFSYPVPYPPYHPPLISPYHFGSSITPVPYHDPLPYFDLDDDVEDMPVPDAIEDTSDDESESPTTPSSRSTSLVFVDPAAVPLPGDNTTLRHPGPHVYSDADDSYLLSFNFDAVPFPNPNHTSFDEC